MIDWKRLKSATGWGFFFGIVSWLLFTVFPDDIPGITVWGIILSRTLTGVVLGMLHWEIPWWLRGLIVGAVINLFMTGIVQLPLGTFIQNFGKSWVIGIWMMLVTGILSGLLIELALKHRDAHLASAKSER